MKKGFPSREEAEKIISESAKMNPGPWEAHCRVAAQCAYEIAKRCSDMDAEKAYVAGLLHDIGRRFGGRHMGHVYDGFKYMTSLGFDEAARICLTHSFNDGTMDYYIGKRDTTPEETEVIRSELEKVMVSGMDDYDRLIQLCDSMALPTGPVEIEVRMGDVKTRYGNYPEVKWNINIELKSYFERKMGMNLYEAVGTEKSRK